ncbi:hypothetical protein AKJ09_05456 [Labilithrix luteola]|uniref:TolB protein n=1 Tax=Labilithrix luteola TaxID=1391654 RepID=A0A0K1PZ78_9BACT|nr:hypothetical protein [Labilithrix luteola]AKU98792.1 hypothetical protein AKJ09_05456 [Labilithrix luteola]
MLDPIRRSLLLTASLLAAVSTFAACGSDSESEFKPTGGDGGQIDNGNGHGSFDPGGGTDDSGTGPGSTQGFDVQPSTLQTITVVAGQTTPTVVFDATLKGAPANVGWSIDRGDVGSIGAGPASTGVFTPSGKTGGLVTIIAGLNGQTIQRQVFVKLTGEQNGVNTSIPSQAAQVPANAAALGAGGGVGGVGGEGLGVAVTDPTITTALGAPTDGTAKSFKFLYPYDKTVFPRGLLAPLLQWSSSLGDADAIQIKLSTTSGSFSWTGTFGRPAILGAAGKFIRHPIPQDVWAMATNTAGGTLPDGSQDKLTVSLVVAKGGAAYGPITETWSIAPGRLAGTVYYNSYGTNLAKNSNDLDKNGRQYGAAVLGIREGATGPSVVAGPDSGINGAGCRVCHTVAQDGSRLVVQHGDNYAASSTYDLKNSNAETKLTGYDNLFGWAGLSPDGTMAFTNAADLAAGAPASRLYTFPPTSTTPLSVTGIPDNLKAGTPTFSPDGKHVSFDFISGAIGAATGNGTQLVAMDFDKTTLAFTNLRTLATMTGGKRAGFPSFFPTNDAVAFHYQIVSSNHRYNTWHQATSQIWWSDLATGTAKSLEQLNGGQPDGTNRYLPTGPSHATDEVLNYEPTVNPVASGGYIWVIFTSRRMYGNVATADAWQSDPRSYDMTDLTKITTKKLWVAAIDLNAAPGTDPSHPAFYLPAQELLAGNARGFWVLDPCRTDGTDCQSGDQCCNGFCQPSSGDPAKLVCSNKPPTATCSMVQEKCSADGDCCDKANKCVNGFCAQPGPH